MANSFVGLISFGWFVAVFTAALQPGPTPTIFNSENEFLLEALVRALHDNRFESETNSDGAVKRRWRIVIEPDE